MERDIKNVWCHRIYDVINGHLLMKSNYRGRRGAAAQSYDSCKFSSLGEIPSAYPDIWEILREAVKN